MPRTRPMVLAVAGTAAVAAVLLSAGALAQVSGTWNLEWNAMSGGGGVSSNDPYAIRGVMGQAVAGGPSTGGSYAVTSGFMPGSGDIKFKAFLPLISRQP
ncbi:MAG: hypothetical protein HS107_11520 [Thermoflexaceae bacterium]|nr:hypothetical protein [Thermoflexaceae bacterium]